MLAYNTILKKTLFNKHQNFTDKASFLTSFCLSHVPLALSPYKRGKPLASVWM